METGHDWLLLCYCPGVSHLTVPDNAAPEYVADALMRNGYEALGRLLTLPLPPQVALACVLDMQCGVQAYPCIVRTRTSQVRQWQSSLAYSTSLTQFVIEAQRWVRAARTALLLLPQIPLGQAVASLFPSTAGILAALPGAAELAHLPEAAEKSAHAASLLNALEISVALREARATNGRSLQLLLAENCFVPSIETAYQLHAETEFLAPVSSRASTGLAQAVGRSLDGETAPAREADALLQTVLAHLEEATPAPAVGFGLDTGRVAHLYHLCAQFVTCTQSLWADHRSLQTCFLLASFQEDPARDDYRDLFDFIHRLRHQLHRLPLTVAGEKEFDPVSRGQLNDCISDILKMQRNLPRFFLHAPARPQAVPPTLSVYLPAQRIGSEYELLAFAQSGWSDFVRLLQAARA